MDRKTKTIKEQFKHLREIAKQSPNPFEGMTKEQAIRKMRQVREELWEERIASSLRHK